ncbi:hypothetical protein V8C40DRAFT_238343 [Trichoderma camerunense]
MPRRSGCSQFAAGIRVLQTVASVLVTSMRFDALQCSRQAHWADDASIPFYFSILPFRQPTNCRSGFSAGKLHKLSNRCWREKKGVA